MNESIEIGNSEAKFQFIVFPPFALLGDKNAKFVSALSGSKQNWLCETSIICRILNNGACIQVLSRS